MRLYAPTQLFWRDKGHVLLSTIEQIEPGNAQRRTTATERAIRNESSGHSERVALGAFQRDLLEQHDVSDRQLARRQKTQPERPLKL